MMTDAQDRFILRTRLPSSLIIQYCIIAFIFIGIPLYFWITLPVWTDKNSKVLNELSIAFFFVFFPILILQYWLNKSQKTQYDGEALYLSFVDLSLRKFPFVRVENILPYEEIAEIVTVGEANIQPFVYVRFRLEGKEWEDKLFISRLFHWDEEIKECLRYMHTKIPEKYTPELIDFMNS